MTKTILVTGGSRGIGAAVARLCAARGWNVAFSYLSRSEEAEAVVREIEAAGAKAIAVKADMAKEADIVALFDAAAKAFGSIDGVVNNAGLLHAEMPLAKMSAERIADTFLVNTVGAYIVAREAARRMARSGGGKGGSLVNVSSRASTLGSPGANVDYAGSKAAVDTLTIGLSKELGPEGVRVNAVRPGPIETEIHTRGGDPDRLKKMASVIPLGRVGKVEEVAETIVFLLSDASAFTSGALIDIAGGR